MKGMIKSLKRTPHNLGSKVGLSKRSTDPEFEDFKRNFATMETATDRFLKETKNFVEAVINLFTSGVGFSNHFSVLFTPIAGEFDLVGKNPEAARTIKNVDKYMNLHEELRSSVSPELDLIESRIVGPIKELQGVLKMIRKSITKRDHKLQDYDRFNNSLTKLRDKKEKSLSDEKNLFKLEQDFEAATNEYDNINNAMKEDLPRFMVLATQFIDPLFQSFYYMQLNIYYLLLEKMNTFAEAGKFDVSDLKGETIEGEYGEKRTDAWHTIENLNIVKRIISSSKMVQAARANNANGSPSTLGRSISSSSSASRSMSVRAPPPPAPSFIKKAPPPPPTASSSRNPPPPYSASSTPANGIAAAAAVAATKRPPPPPPPLKPKPKAQQYVVALYDFAAQADGDLSFQVGDRIEIVERTTSTEDWWTGRLNGRQGVFPGNYVQGT